MAHAFSLDQGHHAMLILFFLFSHPDVGSCLSSSLASADHKSQPSVFSSRSLFIFRFPISAVHDYSTLGIRNRILFLRSRRTPRSAQFTLQIHRKDCKLSFA